MPALHPRACQPPARLIAESQQAGADQAVAGTNRSSRSTYWPVGPMQAFTLCMASHGVCVSSAMMLGDRQYALAQLARAHALDDEALRELAVLLFQHFETQH
jgi:hypothetical protein